MMMGRTVVTARSGIDFEGHDSVDRYVGVERESRRG